MINLVWTNFNHYSGGYFKDLSVPWKSFPVSSVETPLLVCIWFLKNQVVKIKNVIGWTWLLSISYLIFTACVTLKKSSSKYVFPFFIKGNIFAQNCYGFHNRSLESHCSRIIRKPILLPRTFFTLVQNWRFQDVF